MTTCRLWALADCNNFYASCERLFRPDLAHRPVVVLSNNDGCIVARSKEAKALGIKMGEPEFRIRGFLRAHRVKVFSSNYQLYGDISRRVMTTLETVCPVVDQYSIDECFMPLTGALAVNASDAAVTMRERVGRWVGVPISVGVGRTRTLAKVANHIAKHGSGVFIMPTNPDPVLAETPVEEIWGIGSRSTEKLNAIGIRNALELKNAMDIWIRKHLSVTGWNTVLELRGIPAVMEDRIGQERRTIMCSRSFGTRISRLDMLREAVATFSSKAAERLRRADMVAEGLEVTIQTSLFDEGPRYANSALRAFPAPTSDSISIVKAATTALDGIMKAGYDYARAGVMLYGLSPKNRHQGSLMSLLPEARDDSRSDGLMKTLDAVNAKFGRRTLKLACEGARDALWEMRQQHRSPRMTTKWDELAEALCR